MRIPLEFALFFEAISFDHGFQQSAGLILQITDWR